MWGSPARGSGRVQEAFNQELGRLLRERRKELKLSLKTVAERCGVQFQLIHKYEHGEAQVSAFRLWQLARSLDLDATELLKEVERNLPAGSVDGVAASLLPGR